MQFSAFFKSHVIGGHLGGKLGPPPLILRTLIVTWMPYYIKNQRGVFLALIIRNHNANFGDNSCNSTNGWGLIVWTTGNTSLSILLTICDAQKQPNKCNSYANVFPIDDIQRRRNDNGSVYLYFPTQTMQHSQLLAYQNKVHYDLVWYWFWPMQIWERFVARANVEQEATSIAENHVAVQCESPFHVYSAWSVLPSIIYSQVEPQPMIEKMTCLVIWILYSQSGCIWSLQQCSSGSMAVSRCEHIHF